MALNLPPPSPRPPERLDVPSMRAKLIEETLKRTRKTPYEWQLENALDRLAGKDTLTIAATGAGKSLTFVLVPFVLGWQSITWILSPLNVIEEQQVENFNDWKVPTVCINASTNLEREKKKILNGDYQVVISSPEAFFATNKLRKVVVAPELSNRRHFVIADEAHVIRTWGEEFRKEYGNVGNLRAMLYDAPFAAVTATATELVKKAIITALHLGSRQELVVRNLGNYRKNIEYSVYRMTGGLTSFQEITRFFPSPEEIVPSLVFTDAIPDTPKIANVLRDHLGWTGELAQRIIPYHSLREESGKRDAIQAFKDGSCKILVATEALTMGADFADVGLVVQFGATDSVITHCQRSGRSARREHIKARAVMMVTPNQYKKALVLCEGVKDVLPDDFVEVKPEEDALGGVEDGLGDMLVEDGAIEDEPGAGVEEKPTGKGKKTYRRQKMDLDVARFITTQRCRVKVLDEAFENPPHESCYINGNCDLCVARRTRDEAAGESDAHLTHRASQREELVVILESGCERAELIHKSSTKPLVRTGKELTRYQTRLHDWREQKFLEESEKRYIGPEGIITDAALDSIAQSRNIVDLASFDSLKPVWTQRDRWGEEILALLRDVAAEWAAELERDKAGKENQRLEEKMAKDKQKDEDKKAKEEARKAERRDADIAKQVAHEMAQAARDARRVAEIEAKQRADEVTRRANARAFKQSRFESPGRFSTPQRPPLPASPAAHPVSDPSYSTPSRYHSTSPPAHYSAIRASSEHVLRDSTLGTRLLHPNLGAEEDMMSVDVERRRDGATGQTDLTAERLSIYGSPGQFSAFRHPPRVTDTPLKPLRPTVESGGLTINFGASGKSRGNVAGE